MTETYVLEKYKAIQNEDGNWVIFDVPIFAEESRNGIDFDEDWLNQAVALAQKRWNESRYMPPYHEEHNSLKPNESKIVRKNLGLFLPKSVQRGEIEGEEKAVVIADILVSPDVFEDIKAGKYPYLSIETGNPLRPEIASLAALPSRAPEVKQSPLMVAPIHFSEEYQRYQFSEKCMSQQFGVQDIAKKIASNWAGIKGKLLSNPAYQGLIKKIDENSRNIDPKTGKHAGGEVLISPDTVASWLRAIPVDQIMQLTNFLFAEGDSVEKQQFGLMDDIKALGAEYKKGGWSAVKNKLGSQESEAEFQQRLKEQGGRGFAEGDGMEDEKKEQFAGMAPRLIILPNGEEFLLRMNGEYTSQKGGGKSFTVKEAQSMIDSGKAKAGNTAGFAEENPEQMNGEGTSPIDQIKALLPTASDEMLAQILALLQGAGGEIQAAESDPAPVNQFAEIRGSTLQQKFGIVCEVVKGMRKELDQMRTEREREKAFHFAEERLANTSQKSAILSKLKTKKDAKTIRELAEFANEFAGKDPKNLDENDLSNDSTPSEVKEILGQYAPSEKALVCQFAEQWERSSKMVPLDRFVRIQLKGYKYKPNKN